MQILKENCRPHTSNADQVVFQLNLVIPIGAINGKIRRITDLAPTGEIAAGKELVLRI